MSKKKSKKVTGDNNTINNQLNVVKVRKRKIHYQYNDNLDEIIHQDVNDVEKVLEDNNKEEVAHYDIFDKDHYDLDDYNDSKIVNEVYSIEDGDNVLGGEIDLANEMDANLKKSFCIVKVRKRKIRSFSQNDNKNSYHSEINNDDEFLEDIHGVEAEYEDVLDEESQEWNTDYADEESVTSDFRENNEDTDELEVADKVQVDNEDKDEEDSLEESLDIQTEEDDSFSLGLLILILVGCLLLGVVLGYVLYRLALNSSAIVKVFSLLK